MLFTSESCLFELETWALRCTPNASPSALSPPSQCSMTHGVLGRVGYHICGHFCEHSIVSPERRQYSMAAATPTPKMPWGRPRPNPAGSRPRSTKSAPCGVPRDAGYHMPSEYSRSALRTTHLPTYRPPAYLRCAPSESLPLSACQRLRSSASAFLPTERRASPDAACDTYIGHGKEPIVRPAEATRYCRGLQGAAFPARTLRYTRQAGYDVFHAGSGRFGMARINRW